MMNIISNLVEAHIFKENKNGIQFLLLKRNNKKFYPGLWQMVSGKIKPDEKAFEAALREMIEETGLKPEQIWVAPTVNSFYEPYTDSITMVPVFAARVEDKNVVLSEEHSEFKWVEVKEAQALLAWPGQRNAVKLIADYFMYEMNFLNFVEIKT